MKRSGPEKERFPQPVAGKEACRLLSQKDTAHIRTQMIDIGRKLIKNKLYPSKSMVQKVAKVLALRILAERN